MSPSIVSIAGESGSGKTTMGMMVLGFFSPTKARCSIRGKDVHKFNKRQTKQYRKEVQAVFQDPFAVVQSVLQSGPHHGSAYRQLQPGQ